MFVPFHFSLIMTLVVPCLDNLFKFMVLLISALATIGATKLIFLDSGPLGGVGEVRACVGMVCYHCVVHVLNSSKTLLDGTKYC